MADTTSNNASVGAGQQQPDDSNSDYTVITFIVRRMIAKLETMMPVQVVAVHPGAGTPPAAGTVDVQLLVSMLDGSGNAVQRGVVYGLSYFRPQGGPWAIVMDPDVNDFGYIVSASRDITKVAASPGIQVPGSFRRYSFSDGIYMGGCFNAVPAATLWLKPDGTWVLTDKPGNVLEGTSSGITATPLSGGKFLVNGNAEVTGMLKADQLETGEAGLNVTGAITATQEITAFFGTPNFVGLATHTTPTAPSGPISPPTPGS